MFYDRKGKRIDTLEWGRLRQRRKYTIIGREKLSDGVVVSTVWIGIDRAFGLGTAPRWIFETAVLQGWDVLTAWGYSTEEEAIRGHKKTVMKWRTKLLRKMA